jgi:hypothetical protein
MTNPPTSPNAVEPEVVDGAPPADGDGTPRETITQPGKLIRIASMVRTMLEEVRRAPLDEAGRKLLREIHERALGELSDVLSEDLLDELREMILPFGVEQPSDAELRIAQAQLVGWLEGLFHGIQASMVSQQLAAQAQLEQMRRQIGPGVGGPGAQADTGRSGTYL